jgi:hypothetical protein
LAWTRLTGQELLLAVDDILVTKDRRLQALSLLSSFVRLQPPHLHLVLETQVIKHLHSCLLMDQSPTVVDLALTILIMFIPHITTAIVSDLPTLFLIYSRILCWDQYVCDAKYRTSSESESDGSDTERPQVQFDSSWRVIDSPVEGRQAFTPKPNYLFTFLYGLFPLNFMNFIRKPKRYLKMKGFANSDDLDLHPELIRLRSDIHRSQHKLHSNFFTTTPEDELTDDRWLISEPAELVSECLSLCIAVAVNLGDPGPPPSTKLPPLPRKARRKMSKVQHLDDESVLPPAMEMRPPSSRNTMSTTVTASSNGNEFKFPPRHSSHNSLKDHVSLSPAAASQPRQINEDPASPVEPTVPRRLPISAPPSPPRSVATTPTLPRLQSFAQVLSRYPIPNPALPGGDAYNTAILQREVMLLKNDLNFERFQKQKYIEQVGHMQQKQMATLSAETDAQTVASANKVLRCKLAASDERHEQLQREMAASRTLAKKVEEQLTAKLRALREDERQWALDAAVLQRALDAGKREITDLRARATAAARGEQAARDALARLTVDAAEIDALRAAVQAASARLRALEAREQEFARATEEGAQARAQLAAARAAAARAEGERERQRRAFELRVQQLEAAASSATSAAAAATAQAAAAAASSGSNGAANGIAAGANLPPTVQTMLDSALAARDSKITQLRRSYEALQHRFLDLELRNQELQGHGPRPGSVLSLTRYAEDYMSSPHQNPFAPPPPSSPHQNIFAPSPPLGGIGAGSVQPLPRSLSQRRAATDPSSRAFPPPAPSSGASSASSPTSASAPSMRRGPFGGALTEDAERELEAALERAATHDFHISPTESLGGGSAVSSAVASTVKPAGGPGSHGGSRSGSRSGSVSTGSGGPPVEKREPVVKSFGRG